MEMNGKDEKTCPECGSTLAEGAGVCHGCLLQQVMKTATGGDEVRQPPMPPEMIADHFPQFEIQECLGRGGMGVVYLARQKSLNRMVALKILAPEREEDEKFAERFAKEAELLGRMNHPGIVTVYDFGEVKGLYFLVMEYIDGVNLRDILRDGKLEPKRALAIVPKICDALQFAHERGIAHRDIKPENILLDRDGQVKIADFGVASIIGDAHEARVGTPSYMAPESEGSGADHRGDIYALGVVFYEMLTGERPSSDFIKPSARVQVDVALDEIVLRALEKSPERRYQAVSEMSRELETILSDKVEAPNERSSRGMVERVIFLMAGVIVSIIVAVIFFYQKPETESETSTENDDMKLKDITKKVGAVVAAGTMVVSTASAEPEKVSDRERKKLRKEALERMAEDRKEYDRQEMGELEELYQIANNNWKTDKSKVRKAMKELVKKYKKANRTGCAMVYLGQKSYGKERDEYLTKAIKDHSDCYYLNGVQVGGWARYLRLMDLRSDGEDRKADKLEEEIRKKYKKAITHSGFRIVDILDDQKKKAEE